MLKNKVLLRRADRPGFDLGPCSFLVVGKLFNLGEPHQPHRGVMRSRMRQSECLAHYISFFLWDRVTTFQISLNAMDYSYSPTPQTSSRPPSSLTWTVDDLSTFVPASCLVPLRFIRHTSAKTALKCLHAGAFLLLLTLHSFPALVLRYSETKMAHRAFIIRPLLPAQPHLPPLSHHTPVHFCLQNSECASFCLEHSPCAPCPAASPS